MDDLAKTLNKYLAGFDFEEDDGFRNETLTKSSTATFVSYGDGVFKDYEPGTKWFSLQFSSTMAKFIDDTHPEHPEWRISTKPMRSSAC